MCLHGAAMTRLVYSLWLVPPRSMYQNLSTLIQNLAGEFGALPFEPHVTLQWATLSSESDAIDKARQIAKAIPPLTITLSEIGYEASYYRALYYAVDLTDALSSAYEIATALFCGAEGLYRPHLSLLYGRYSAGRKAATIKKCRPWISPVSTLKGLTRGRFVHFPKGPALTRTRERSDQLHLSQLVPPRQNARVFASRGSEHTARQFAEELHCRAAPHIGTNPGAPSESASISSLIMAVVEESYQAVEFERFEP